MQADVDLIAGLIEGNEAVYTSVYRNHFAMIRYLVKNNQGTEEDARDVFHDGIMIIIENARKPDFKLKSAFKTYLYSVCRNVWYANVRKRTDFDKFKDYEQYIDVSATVEEKQKTEDQLSLIDACIERLGEPCKSLLLGFYHFRKSMQTLAEDLGYSNADHAKSQKYKCLQRLKKLALNESK